MNVDVVVFLANHRDISVDTLLDLLFFFCPPQSVHFSTLVAPEASSGDTQKDWFARGAPPATICEQIGCSLWLNELVDITRGI